MGSPSIPSSIFSSSANQSMPSSTMNCSMRWYLIGRRRSRVSPSLAPSRAAARVSAPHWLLVTPLPACQLLVGSRSRSGFRTRGRYASLVSALAARAQHGHVSSGNH
eukprot:1176067-Prorocentrum_minimum.AAC.2